MFTFRQTVQIYINNSINEYRGDGFLCRNTILAIIYLALRNAHSLPVARSFYSILSLLWCMYVSFYLISEHIIALWVINPAVVETPRFTFGVDNMVCILSNRSVTELPEGEKWFTFVTKGEKYALLTETRADWRLIWCWAVWRCKQLRLGLVKNVLFKTDLQKFKGPGPVFHFFESNNGLPQEG